ncbi:MAG: flagellar protein FlgN [Treponema sp.]|nr:flagellar protein FlgN [Treponema sp.]
MENLSREEVEERVAIIKRFKKLLEQQRTKFQEYLKVLECQESKISQEDAEALLSHTELETQIVASIGSLQKVIVPMQELYTKSKAATYNPADVIPISKLQNELKSLQSQVLEQNEKNRILLRVHMDQLKKQITEFKNPYRNLGSVYKKTATAGSRIQVEC